MDLNYCSTHPMEIVKGKKVSYQVPLTDGGFQEKNATTPPFLAPISAGTLNKSEAVPSKGTGVDHDFF
eukprot:7595260-Ditylum_brightwellii.AAC.1